MYVPKYAEAAEAAALHEFIEAHPFGLLATAAGGLEANHYPFLLHAADGSLWTHVARANPQASRLSGGAPCLAVFTGPHAYVSPAMYVKKLHVPTWNYTAVHARCEARLVEDDDAIEDILRRTVARFDDRWKYDLPADFTAQTDSGPHLETAAPSAKGGRKKKSSSDAARKPAMKKTLARRCVPDKPKPAKAAASSSNE
ncbi:MAG: FMN-binding negative transcriptional regulator [Elusimicrobiota bacterium]